MGRSTRRAAKRLGRLRRSTEPARAMTRLPWSPPLTAQACTALGSAGRVDLRVPLWRCPKRARSRAVASENFEGQPRCRAKPGERNMQQ
jgi:hypothetical protein